jgi:hypothetical protein
MARQSLRFGTVTIPDSFEDLPKQNQNLYRHYFVDGNIVQIEKDRNEADYNYRYRVSFILARSFNPGARMGELTVNSRIASNKRWSPIVKDEDSGSYLQTPYYTDQVEDQYKRIKALPTKEI